MADMVKGVVALNNAEIQEQVNFFREKILNPQFDWNDSTTTLDEFLSKYTLHDSNLFGLWSDISNDLTIALKLDPYWNKSVKENYSHEDSSWPNIFIRFPFVLSIRLSLFEGDLFETIIDVESSILNRNEIQALFPTSQCWYKEFDKHNSKRKLYHTKIGCVLNNIEIIHDEQIRILCLDNDGERIEI